MNPAFAYVYDDFLTDRRYERDLAMFETEIARRGIEGHIGRLAVFRSAKEMVRDMARLGVKNVIFVGNDQTLLKMMWFLPEMDVTVGYAPLAPPSDVASLLGLPVGQACVDALAGRLVETLDVGRLDDRYFLTEVVLPSTVASLEVDGRYRVKTAEGGAIAIRNLGPATQGRAAANPKDGWLEAVLQTKTEQTGVSRILKKTDIEETRILLKEGRILSNEPIDVYVDGYVQNGFTFRLSMVPNRLKIITGKDRGFGV